MQNGPCFVLGYIYTGKAVSVRFLSLPLQALYLLLLQNVCPILLLPMEALSDHSLWFPLVWLSFSWELAEAVLSNFSMFFLHDRLLKSLSWNYAEAIFNEIITVKWIILSLNQTTKTSEKFSNISLFIKLCFIQVINLSSTPCDMGGFYFILFLSLHFCHGKLWVIPFFL